MIAAAEGVLWRFGVRPAGARPWCRRCLDRILDEVHAQPGDARLLCELFGMAVHTAERFIAAVNTPTSPATPADDAAGKELMVR